MIQHIMKYSNNNVHKNINRTKEVIYIMLTRGRLVITGEWCWGFSTYAHNESAIETYPRGFVLAKQNFSSNEPCVRAYLIKETELRENGGGVWKDKKMPRRGSHCFSVTCLFQCVLAGGVWWRSAERQPTKLTCLIASFCSFITRAFEIQNN